MATPRTTRSATTRSKTTRKQSWAPPSMLEAPDAPAGYKHRWIRAESGGVDDKINMSKRMREGFEPVRAEDYPDFIAPTIDNGQHAGVIGVGGLILAKIPEEIANERKDYFEAQANAAMEAVDNDFMRESDGSMPLSKPDRRTQVTFGNPENKGSEDS